ncbi:MAG: GTP cyclohydrolase I FolE [Hyphomicrobium sp.]
MRKMPSAPNVKTLPRRRPTRAEAEEAVRTLIAWSGDDPARDGLLETPARVVTAYSDYFSGYQADVAAELSATFNEPNGYDDMVLVANIAFESHCEHHIAPFMGMAHVAYIPDGAIVGLSKLARIVEIFARRLQTQEGLTGDIAGAIMSGLNAKGVAVMMSAEHQCMSMRGVRQRTSTTVTTRFLGVFESDPNWQHRFLTAVHATPVR